MRQRKILLPFPFNSSFYAITYNYITDQRRNYVANPGHAVEAETRKRALLLYFRGTHSPFIFYDVRSSISSLCAYVSFKILFIYLMRVALNSKKANELDKNKTILVFLTLFNGFRQ